MDFGPDYIIHASGAENQVMIYAATTRNMVEEARRIHQTTPVMTAALGRLLTAGSIMGSMLKNEDDLITLQIKCSGPAGGLTVTACPDGSVRGYAVHPDADMPPKARGKLDVGGAVGSGELSVIRDLGLKEPYVGTVQLVSGEIAEDLTYYFASSEQVNSSVGLGVLVDTDNTVRQAGGFILQLMPFASEELVSSLEKNLSELPPVTTMLDDGLDPESIIMKVLKGHDINFYDRVDAEYKCRCSRERVERAVISIGSREIQEMIDDGEDVEVNCQFCGRHYTFSVDELKGLLARADRHRQTSVPDEADR